MAAQPDWLQVGGVLIAAGSLLLAAAGFIGRRVIDAIKSETANLRADLSANTRAVEANQTGLTKVESRLEELSRTSMQQGFLLTSIQQATLEHGKLDDTRFADLKATTELLRQRSHDVRDDMVGHMGKVALDLDERIERLERAEAIRSDREAHLRRGPS